MSDIRARIANLSPEQRRLLELKLAGKRGGARRSATIPPRCGESAPRLSYAQERLWFLDQLEPGSTQYIIPYAVRIRGNLNVPALEQTLNALLARHEVLRTAFGVRDGTPFQVIAPSARINLVQAELSSLPAQERESELQRRLRQEMQRPFDLRSDLMLRAFLVKLGAAEHALLLSVHHIAADGWSVEVLFREIAALYEAFCVGRSSPLPPLPIQYADFAAWQRQWLAQDTMQAQLGFWKKQLQGAPTLQLPGDRPRTPAVSYAGATYTTMLPKALTTALKALSRRENVTEFMLLLAAFDVLLARYCGQDDITVGTPVANRTRTELESLVGFFVNTLVLRADLSGDLTFRQLLTRVRQTALDAYANQDQPFEKLVEELQPERGGSINPLFQVMFVLQNPGEPELRLPGLRVAPLPVGDGTSKFDLMLAMRELPDGYRLVFEYRTALFDPRTIARMADRFHRLLEGIAADPDAKIAHLPLLSNEERWRVLVHYNQTERPYPREKGIQELFEAQATRAPDAVAASFNGAQMTYAQLNARANQLAHYLRKLNVGPDVLVGLCLERSLEMLVGTLGIIKAGGAYLPLDPAYPPERLALMVADARAPVLLTESKLRTALPNYGAKIVCLDTDARKIAAESGANPACTVDGDNLAYVIYTSGSTGKPKGNCIVQKGVNRLVRNTDYIEIGPSDSVVQGSNISFDAATFEIWGALLNGARLVVMPKDIALSPRDLAAFLRREKITTLFLTTALFNLIAGEVPDAFASLETLLFGGEAVDPKWVRHVLKHGRPKRLLHVYGPTEVTTFATWHLVNDVPESATTVPIGQPIANTEAYLLDRHFQPVPVGIPGELFLGGDGLARGYLNQPELTAEKFVAHPFAAEPQARLYRTGDIVRMLDGGAIEFIGRADHQVKIRGFRIELGEIEVVLAAHPDVKENIVVARTDGNGKRLVAYAVLKNDGVGVGELRQYLAGRMPEYMIPSAIVLLPALPLNANGKVDRAALPPPESSAASHAEKIEPWTPLHCQLIGIWEELLRVRKIGITDDFFELGGHSLLAVQMMERVEEACGRKVPLSSLFAGATIERLADELLRQRDREPAGPLLKIQAGGSRPPFFFLHGDFNGGGLYCRKLAKHLGEDQPVYAFHPHGVNGSSVPGTVEEMAADHLKYLRAVAPEGPYMLGGFCGGGYVAFEMARQLAAAGQRVQHLVLIEVVPVPWTRRLVYRCVDGLARMRGLERRATLQLFEHWANRGYRFGKFLEADLKSQIGTTWQKTLNALQRFTRLPPLMPAASATRTGREMPRDVALAYDWALSGYRPRRYAGPVTLILAGDLESHALGAANGWRKVAPQLESFTVPGDHLSCITRYCDVLAERLRACLGNTSDAQQSVLARTVSQWQAAT